MLGWKVRTNGGAGRMEFVPNVYMHSHISRVHRSRPPTDGGVHRHTVYSRWRDFHKVG